jgi:hypothetical protein
MTCEKQFLPYGDHYLYCSESYVTVPPNYHLPIPSNSANSLFLKNSCRRSDQASSTSTYHSYKTSADYSSSRNNSYASDMSEPKDIIPQASPSRPGSMLFASSPPATPGNYYHESAVSALRSLSNSRRPPSPPSPTNTTGFWPFGKNASTSPGASHLRPSAAYLSSSNYDGGYYGGPNGVTHNSPTDRPLPSRSSRPKSVELVTPIFGR